MRESKTMEELLKEIVESCLCLGIVVDESVSDLMSMFKQLYSILPIETRQALTKLNDKEAEGTSTDVLGSIRDNARDN